MRVVLTTFFVCVIDAGQLLNLKLELGEELESELSAFLFPI